MANKTINELPNVANIQQKDLIFSQSFDTNITYRESFKDFKNNILYRAKTNEIITNENTNVGIQFGVDGLENMLLIGDYFDFYTPPTSGVYNLILINDPYFGLSFLKINIDDYYTNGFNLTDTDIVFNYTSGINTKEIKFESDELRLVSYINGVNDRGSFRLQNYSTSIGYSTYGGMVISINQIDIYHTDKTRIESVDEINLSSDRIKIDSIIQYMQYLPVYDSDVLASSLSQNQLYRTTTGELRIKL